MSLAERLDKIKSPKLQNQRETAVVLSAIEETLKDQNQEFTSTAYFAALLALLNQTLTTSNGIVNKELATSVVYLLDIVTSYVPPALLRSKVTPILTSLDPALTQQDADAPLIRPSIGCLESLLLAQDATAWALPQTQISPRRGVGRLLALGLDHRPKIRKRAQEALTKILQQPPPSPSLDHPAADLCASTALHRLQQMVQETGRKSQKPRIAVEEHYPSLIHALQLVKTVAYASGGWPVQRLDELCELVLGIAKSSNEFLTKTSFEVFEAVFTGMADEVASAKIPRMLEVITELKPSANDMQLLPPWIAVLSRGYDISAQMFPEDTFMKLPAAFELVSGFLASTSHNIRISASECLISFCANCIPSSVILEPSVYDEKTLEKIGKVALGLLSVRYQSAWMESFSVFAALFETLKWRASPMLNEVVVAIGELRGSDAFTGKNEADKVLGNAVSAIGPEALLSILPLNLLGSRKDQPGRAWLLPILRDNIINARLSHFRTELVPLSEQIEAHVKARGKSEKTMEIKIFETLFAQIWSLLPGYCTLSLDVKESFDTAFAEQVSKLLYELPDLRVDLCKALQVLVESNVEVSTVPTDETDLIAQRRITQEMASQSIAHLATMAGSMLAVLFNVYSQTLPQYRGYILQCVNAYLGIIPKEELDGAFTEVTKQLEASLVTEQNHTSAKHQKDKNASTMPPTSHALIDLVITMAIHLPRSSFPTLWAIAKTVLPKSADAALQKKAYKLIPRLEQCELGLEALRLNSGEVQGILLDNSKTTAPSARRERLAAFASVIRYMPNNDLHFVPAILPEVLIGAKETNEKGRTIAFDLLVLMGQRMKQGGTLDRARLESMAMEDGGAEIAPGSLEEYLVMLTAGLAGATPHMISAGATALARVIYEFHEDFDDASLTNLLEIMLALLEHNSREVVRAVLGFFKVATVAFSTDLLNQFIPNLVPALTRWSGEQKARLRVKVKGILDRLIRRFGFEEVAKHCPEAERKLIVNVRKRRERAKRKKDLAKAGIDQNGAEEDGNEPANRRQGQFASEFDRALEDSDSDTESEMSFDATGVDKRKSSHHNGSHAQESSSSDDGSGENDNRAASSRTRSKKPSKSRAKTYIIEPPDPTEPLDLLDRSTLGHLTSTRPPLQRKAGVKRHTARVDLDGKLVFGKPSGGGNAAASDNAMDAEAGPANAALDDGTGGIDAYVAAVSGRDAPQRGRGGRMKFKNRRDGIGGEDGQGEDGPIDGMEGVEGAELRARNGSARSRGHSRRGSAGRGSWERKKKEFGRRALEGHRSSGSIGASARGGASPAARKTRRGGRGDIARGKSRR